MFFYVDESGNSGRNLFDQTQPILSYGVLSSHTSLDLLGTREHASIRRKIGADRIHANELKYDGLRKIADDLVALQLRFGLRFDYYFIDKVAFAAVAFHSAVFDAGLNDAVPWSWYWTPLRFPVVAALSEVMNEELLRESWDLCQLPRKRVEEEVPRIVKLLESVRDRVADEERMGTRLKEIILDGLRYAINFPTKMDFGIFDKKALTPNAVGFQFVLTTIAKRLKASRRKALGIIVDHQSEFNSAQMRTFEFHSGVSKAMNETLSEKEAYLAHPFHEGVREDSRALLSHFPDKAFTVSRSEHSLGLQIADVFLWLTNRFLRHDKLPGELVPVVREIVRTGWIDGISIPAMMQRFKAFESGLPPEASVTAEQREAADEARERHREKLKEMNLD